MNDRLFRSRDDRMLAGVAGGLAELWDVDPSFVRIVWALLILLTGGIALVVYIVMALVVPEEDVVWPPQAAPPVPVADTHTTSAADTPTPSTTEAGPIGAQPAWTPPGAQPWPDRATARAAARQARAERRAARRERGGLAAGAIVGVILVALGIFFLAREWLPQLDFDWFWPVVLVAVGVMLVVSALARPSGDAGGQS